jgi:hypothetical protein
MCSSREPSSTWWLAPASPSSTPAITSSEASTGPGSSSPSQPAHDATHHRARRTSPQAARRADPQR